MRGVKTPATVDAYLALTPPPVRRKLARLRAMVRAEAPGVTEKIAYGLVAFHHLGRPLIYLGAFQRHLGCFPGAATVAAFEERLAGLTHAKGSIQFQLPADPPWALFRALVRHRVAAIEAQAQGGPARRKGPARAAAGKKKRPAARRVSRSAPAPGRGAPRR